MAGRGLRCPNQPRMSQIPDSNMDPKGVKHPYFTGRVSAPQSYIKQTGVNIIQVLLSAESWAIRICTLWLNKPRLLVLRVALVPCSQGWQAPHSSFLSLVWEEGGVLGRHLGAPVSGWLGTPDPIILEQHPRELFLDSAAAGSGSQALPLKLSGSCRKSKVKDYFIMMTYPSQWGRGAYNEFYHNFNI